MATHKINILGWATNAGSSGQAYFEPYSIKATNDRWRRLVGIMNDTASDIAFQGGFVVPENYAGSACVICDWTSTATTGSVVLGVDYRAVAATESLDQTGVQESASVADSSPSAVNLFQQAVIPLTSGNLVAGDEVEFDFMRKGTNATDDMAAAVIVFSVLFGYSDT